MAIVTIGIDLAKNGFAVHGVEETGRSVLIRPKVPRAKLIELIAALPPGRIAREACSGDASSECTGHRSQDIACGVYPYYDLMQPMLAYSYKQRVARLLSRIGIATAVPKLIRGPKKRLLEEIRLLEARNWKRPRALANKRAPICY